MNGLARLGFILLGSYGLVAGLRSVGHMLAQGNLQGAADPGTYLSVVVLVGLVLDLGPSALLLAFNRRLADLIFRDRPADDQPTAPALFSAGVAVLGLYLVVIGLAGLVGSVASFVFAGGLRENPHFVYNVSSGSASSAAYLILGSAVYYYGPRMAQRLGGDTPAA